VAEDRNATSVRARLEVFAGRTVTFLFTDIEGSTRLQARLRHQWSAVRGEHHRLIRESFLGSFGVEVDTQGDSFFYVFPRALDAVNGALTAQRALASNSWPDGAGPRVRMGLHSGEPQVSDDGFVGLSVVRAARIMAAAHGGQVLLSQATYALVHDDLPTDVAARDLGQYRLKDFDDPQRLFQLSAPGIGDEFPRARAERSARRRTPLLAGAAVIFAALAAVLAVVLTRGGSETVRLSPNEVAVLDSRNGRVSETFPLGAAPAGMAYARGAAWVAVRDNASIARVTANGSAARNIPLGRPGTAHPTLLASSGNLLWVALGPDRKLQRLDTRYVGRLDGDAIPTTQAPIGLAIGAGKLWVATGTSVEERDALTGAPRGRPLFPQLGANALAFAGGRLWVGGGNGIAEIDPQTGSTLTTVSVPGQVTTMTAGSESVWAGYAPTNQLDRTSRTGLARIDPVSATVSATLDLDARPVSVAAVAGGIWVATADDSLIRVNPAGVPAERERIHLGVTPTALAGGAGRLWLASQ
jgi:class 3 adenylate cyclase/sugar lactone lactonase YvrE